MVLLLEQLPDSQIRSCQTYLAYSNLLPMQFYHHDNLDRLDVLFELYIQYFDIWMQYIVIWEHLTYSNIAYLHDVTDHNNLCIALSHRWSWCCRDKFDYQHHLAYKFEIWTIPLPMSVAVPQILYWYWKLTIFYSLLLLPSPPLSLASSSGPWFRAPIWRPWCTTSDLSRSLCSPCFGHSHPCALQLWVCKWRRHLLLRTPMCCVTLANKWKFPATFFRINNHCSLHIGRMHST